MKLKIGSLIYDYFQEYNVALRYDSVASTFSFKTRFNPENEAQRNLFKPLNFNQIILSQDDEVLLTGVALNSNSVASSIDNSITVSGYSKTGVLEDCEIPVNLYPLQSDNLSLREIAQKIVTHFGINLIIDDSVSSQANQIYTKTTADPKSKIKAYLSELAFQRGIIITHDENSNLLLTTANFNATPIAKFTEDIPSINIKLDVTGQGMNSQINVIKQANIDGGNAGQSQVSNDLISSFRPTTKIQTSGTDTNTITVARNVRSKQLKNIKLTIELDRNQWLIMGQKKLIRPNNTVLVNSPNNFIFNDSLFFVESVTYSGDEKIDIVTLGCVIPEVYSNLDPVNIFE